MMACDWAVMHICNLCSIFNYTSPHKIASGLKTNTVGTSGGSAVEHLPLAQVMIPGTWDRVLHQAPLKESATPSACVSASLCVPLMNK